MEHPATGVRARPAAPLGRHEDVRRVEALVLGGARLVTLRGPGGIGKTTLARHVAQDVRTGFDDVLFVDLSAERDPRHVLHAVAAHLPETARHADPFGRLVAFAEGRRVLLVLDNFEQVVDAAVDVQRLLDAAPTLQVLVTSRVTLRVHAEHEVEVAPLALPGALGNVTDSAAAQLFVQRARQVNAAFGLDDATRPLVADVVTRLEGVPLAIELAASRLRTFALPDLLARLDHPLRVLKADFRDRPERLRSLRAAVQWSYDLLSDEDREVFECCAVFEGSFTPEALVAVWGGEEVLDRVEHLLEQSFLHRVEAAVTRWRMLQPLRELAAERLSDHPRAEEWRERHARHYLRVLEDMQRGREGPHPRTRDLYLPDYANMRAGLLRATERGEAETALRYLGGLLSLWSMAGLHADGRGLGDAALRLPSAGFERLRMRALIAQMENLLAMGDIPAMEACMREHHALAVAHGSDEDLAWSNCGLSIALHWGGKSEEALQVNQRVLDWFEGLEASGTPSLNALHVYGVVTVNSVSPLITLGRYETALQRALQGVERQQRAGNPRGRARRALVGDALLHLGRLREAALEYHVALEYMIEMGMAAQFSGPAWGFMHVLAEPRPDLAVGFAAFATRETRFSTSPHFTRWRARGLDALRAALPPEEFERAWRAGVCWTPEEALKHAEDYLRDHERAEEVVTAPPEPSPAAPSGLTAREAQVLALVREGHPDRRIAKLLEISPATVSKHVSNMLSKLGLRNRTELARWATERRGTP